MPELPEVETTVRGLRPVLEGQRIASLVTRRGDLRRPFPDDLAQRMTGATVTALGPEPLGSDFTAAYLRTALAGRRTSIKLALLDQRIVAGLGNIYVCEALYHARISPRRAAGQIALSRLERLVEAVREVLGEAIAAGGSTLRDYARPDGELGYFSKQFAVYGREGEPCGCGGVVHRYAEGGRSTFWCPACQR